MKTKTFATLFLLCISLCANAQELFPVKGKNGKWGYKYEYDGKWIIRPKYKWAEPFSYGLAAVTVDKGYYKEGHRIIKSKYRCGYIDKKGKIVIPLEYDSTDTFSEGLGRVSMFSFRTRTFRHGFIDTRGCLVIPMDFDYAENFKNGRALVRWTRNGKCYECYIDKEGNPCSEIYYYDKASGAKIEITM